LSPVDSNAAISPLISKNNPFPDGSLRIHEVNAKVLNDNFVVTLPLNLKTLASRTFVVASKTLSLDKVNVDVSPV
jgi:hypothetical protein